MILKWLKSAKSYWIRIQQLQLLSHYKIIIKLFLSLRNLRHNQNLYCNLKLTLQITSIQHLNKEDQCLKMLILMQISHLIYTMIGLIYRFLKWNIQDQNTLSLNSRAMKGSILMIRDFSILKIKMTLSSFTHMNIPNLRVLLPSRRLMKVSTLRTIDFMILKIKMISFRLDPNGFEILLYFNKYVFKILIIN